MLSQVRHIRNLRRACRKSHATWQITSASTSRDGVTQIEVVDQTMRDMTRRLTNQSLMRRPASFEATLSVTPKGHLCGIRMVVYDADKTELLDYLKTRFKAHLCELAQTMEGSAEKC